MALCEDLTEHEARVLIVNKAAQLAHLGMNVPEHQMKREDIIAIGKRIVELADAIPPERKQ